MQMLTKNCRKSESSLSLSYENAVTAGTNFRPFKATRRDERFLICAYVNFAWKACASCFNWPKYACI